MSETPQQPQREYEGPARVYSDYKYDRISANQAKDHFDKVYGPEGNGWELVLPEASPLESPDQRQKRQLGRLAGSIVIHVDGDKHAEERGVK